MMKEKRFLDFLDMFDGGGAGQMGDKFQGGGLYSMIGNAFGSPYGSEDPERMAARQAFYGSDQIGGAPMAPPPQAMFNPAPAQSPMERFGGMGPADYSPPAQSPMERFGGMGPAAYTAPPPQRALGTVVMPMPRPDASASIQEIEAYLRSIGHPDYQ